MTTFIYELDNSVVSFFCPSQVYFLSKSEGGHGKPFTPWSQTQVFCKTFDCPALLDIKDKEMVMPGEDASIGFILLKKMVYSDF